MSDTAHITALFPLQAPLQTGRFSGDNREDSGGNRVSYKSRALNNRPATPLREFASQTVSVQPGRGFFLDVKCHGQPPNELLKVRNAFRSVLRMPYHLIQRETLRFQQTGVSTLRVVRR
jgi:hypothetical protein